MPPQIKQAKLETLEAIIKEVENRLLEAKAEFIEFGLQRTEGEIDALSDLLTKLQAEKELLGTQ